MNIRVGVGVRTVRMPKNPKVIPDWSILDLTQVGGDDESVDEEPKSFARRCCGCVFDWIINPSRCCLAMWVLITLVSAGLVFWLFLDGLKSAEAAAIADAQLNISSFYSDERICGLNVAEDILGDMTLTTTRSELNDTLLFGHCGPCGACSKLHDIATLNATSDSLIMLLTYCSVSEWVQWVPLLPFESGDDCMDASIQFSDDCNECWKSRRKCISSKCLATAFFGSLWGDYKVTLECDDALCGPEFLACSGTNRVRAGIPVPDLDREVCNTTAQY